MLPFIECVDQQIRHRHLNYVLPGFEVNPPPVGSGKMSWHVLTVDLERNRPANLPEVYFRIPLDLRNVSCAVDDLAAEVIAQGPTPVPQCDRARFLVNRNDFEIILS